MSQGKDMTTPAKVTWSVLNSLRYIYMILGLLKSESYITYTTDSV